MQTPSHTAPLPDLMQLRRDYQSKSLSETDVDPDPVHQFVKWLNEAIAAKANEPNAMILATATPDGTPSARVVLLKGVDADGFSFFTNYQSRKGQELEANPRAALVFYWPELERQVRVEGTVRRTTAEESDQYFTRRPPAARVGSAASPQSRVLSGRAELEQYAADLLRQFPTGEVPRPAHWGGYRVVPTRIEFWQGRPSRLHDRIDYVVQGSAWLPRRLAP